jgi:hypothetical protein
MKPLMLIMADAVTLRGIVDLLAEAPATTREMIATQHEGAITIDRCCRALQAAGIIGHPTVTRTVVGVATQVPQLEWHLTAEYRRGEIDFDPEDMAGGI